MGDSELPGSEVLVAPGTEEREEKVIYTGGGSGGGVGDRESRSASIGEDALPMGVCGVNGAESSTKSSTKALSSSTILKC